MSKDGSDCGESFCSLPRDEQRERAAMIRREILPQAKHRQALADGFALEFAHTPQIERQLEDLVAFERACCSGLEWTLSRSSDGLELRVTGLPPGTDLLRALEGAEGAP